MWLQLRNNWNWNQVKITQWFISHLISNFLFTLSLPKTLFVQQLQSLLLHIDLCLSVCRERFFLALWDNNSVSLSGLYQAGWVFHSPSIVLQKLNPTSGQCTIWDLDRKLLKTYFLFNYHYISPILDWNLTILASLPKLCNRHYAVYVNDKQ